MDDYLVVGRIGSGAQGSIFQVSHRDNGAVYALKAIYCCGQQQVNAALKEVKYLVALRHPNIVSYEDFFLQLNTKQLKTILGVESLEESHDSLFSSLYGKKPPISHPQGKDLPLNEQGQEVGVCLIMELCSNGDLQSVIGSMREKFMDTGKHPANEKTIVSWIRQCALALEYIHGKGFIHRDVKPMNVFFDAQGNVKLGDFGVASTVGLGCQSAVGTPDYLAPERMLQQVYDAKVDIWGLGMVALESITLSNHPMNSRVLDSPNAADSVVELVVKMGFSRYLGELIRSMLQRRPSDRPSASSIIKALPLSSPPPVMQGPVLRPRKVQGRKYSSICALCEVEPSTISCSECKEAYCYMCDTVRHKHSSRGTHERSQISSNDSSVDHLSDSTCDFPLTPKKIVIPLPARCNSSPQTIRVPKDCSSLPDAIAMAASLLAETIQVSSGYVSHEPLVLTDNLPRGVTIIGDSPPPVIEVSSGAFAVSISSGVGTLVNLIIRHRGKRSGVSSDKSKGRPPRPSAVLVSGGEWQLTNCQLACQEGSGMTILSEARSTHLPMKVQECSFSDIKTAAVVFHEGTGGLIERNSFCRCGYAAVLLKAGANPKICRNRIKDCSDMGIMCEDSEGVLEENEIIGNRGCGISLKGMRARPILSKNKISDNQTGISCADFSQPYIYENIISANQKAGIFVRGNSFPTVKKNIISNGVEAGVYVFDGGRGLFAENTICNNRNAGVLVTTNGSPEVIENYIHDNAEGVWVCNNGCGSYSKNEFKSNRNGSRDIDDTCNVVWQDNIE